MTADTRHVDTLLALLVGLAAFLLYTGGGAILDPTYTDWLMVGDPATGWLGWQFFRDTPLLQWPLGANRAYGMELGSSIVFSDSLPLLAFAFKPFSAWLPAAFQYYGLWLAACFILQAYFGWKLLRLFATDRWFPLVGAAFFAIAPAMAMRLYGHYALVAHWLLLAGLYLYLRPQASARRWLALLAIATLVHAYLLLMLLALFSADVVQRRWLGQRDWRASLLCLVTAIVTVAVLMWATGYFMLGGVKGVGVGDGPFGYYHSNLYSFLDTDHLWSRLFRDRAGGPGDYEGFAFLGAGMILLLVAALPWLFEQRGPAVRAKLAPIATVALGLFLVAISNRIQLGERELLAYPLPALTSPLTSAFRVSGRFIWPVYYLVYLGIFYLLATGLRRTTATALCALLLVFQLVDGSMAWRHFGQVLRADQVWTSPMRSPLWEPLAARYDKLVVVLPRNNPDRWVELAEFASRHHLPTQAGAFARVEQSRLDAVRERIANELVDGPLDSGALYVFEADGLWQFASSQSPGPAFAGTLDGFRILAPEGCAACPGPPLRAAAIIGSRPASAAPLRFTSDGNGGAHLLHGWWAPEAWGTWSEGDSASVALDLPKPPVSDLELVIEGHAFLDPKHPAQKIHVSVNRKRLATLDYVLGRDEPVRRVRIPQALAGARNGRLLLRFDFANPASPASVGLSADGRRLGLGLVGLELRDAGSEGPASVARPRATAR